MATSAAKKALCATCGKVTGMFTCRGCQKDFCTRHVAEHRQELGKQMDEITLHHDRFRQNLTEQTKDPRSHPLMKQIDDWEQQSIDKIHRSANDARQQLQKTINEYSTELTNKLTKIAEELRKAREDDDFFETDLKLWMEKLTQLKEDLTQPPNTQIEKRTDDTISVISKPKEVLPVRERFGQSLAGIEIMDNGEVIVKKSRYGHCEARGNGEYSSGQHRFRLRIENYHEYKWIFIGIISKSVALQSKSHGSLSSYGWAGSTQVYLNGACHNGFNNYRSDIEKNDIMELFVDCDKRKIRLTNERTGSVSELEIGMNECPFPWQLHFNLYYQNDSLCILQN